MGVGAEGNTESARETKISELEVSLLVDEQVLGLQVAMKDAMSVAVSDTGAELRHEFLDHSLAQSHVSIASVHAAFWERLCPTTL